MAAATLLAATNVIPICTTVTCAPCFFFCDIASLIGGDVGRATATVLAATSKDWRDKVFA